MIARFWKRGPAWRIGLVIGACAIVLLLAVGVWHFMGKRDRTGARSPGATAELESAGNSILPHDPAVALTDLDAEEQSDSRGRKSVSVRIGVAPRKPELKGAVEIRVFFFDLNPANELRPTDAQVDYDWLTPARDWTDPAPKFLRATYRGPRTSQRREPDLHYGGFLVRVFFDGQLQDERSEPAEIATALRQETRPAVLSGASAPVAPDPNRPVAPPPAATASASPAVTSNAPYGRPVPDKPGFLLSPYDGKFLIDVRGFPPGTEVTDPNTGKPFRVP